MTLQAEVLNGLLRDIFNHLRNFINKKNGKINTYVAFSKIQICSSKILHVELLQYFKDIIINFERVVEMSKGVLFIHALVNKIRMLKC